MTRAMFSGRMFSGRMVSGVLAGVTAAAAALAGAALGPAGPAGSAPPTGDCAAPYPAAALVAGQAVTGQTVQQGTAPQGFTGEILGVVDDGIGPDLDMIMVRLNSAEITRVGGIWQGMSGSPVYAADGRLIGAVAYGLAFGSSPVAGLTPFEQMDDYLAAPGARVEVTRRQARTIAAHSSVTTPQATQGFAQLRIPYGVSGVSMARVAAAADRPYLDTDLAGSSATVDLLSGPGADTMVAGGNIAGTLSYGDITQGGVGTVTSVCGARTVAFGHPFGFFGSTTLTMHPASAIYVQEDPVGPPFKVANFGPPVGTITDDRLTGISGSFDVLPPTMGIASTVAFGSRIRTGTTRVSVPLVAADTTLFQILANHDRTLDGITKGSELQSWTIAGRKPDGTTFKLARTDRYTSSDLATEVPFDVADAVFNLGEFEGVRLDGVTVSGVVTKDATTWTLDRVKVRDGKKWRKAKNGGRIDAVPGKKLRLRAVLTGPSGTRIVPVTVKVPAKAARGGAFLTIVGGNDYFSDVDFSEEEGGFETGFTSLDAYLKAQRRTVRNDEVVADLFVEGPRSTTTKQVVSRPQSRVVSGFLDFQLRFPGSPTPPPPEEEG